MSQLTTVEEGKLKIELQLSPEDYTKAIESAYKRTKNRYSIPGFRKGKAPRAVIENIYGPSVFWDNELDIAMSRLCSEAIGEHKIVPELEPEFIIEKLNDDKSLDFSVEIVTVPEVTLGEYKGIEAVKPAYTVTDEQVEAEIKNRLAAHSVVESVERPVENGDTVVIDFAGFLGDEQFEGGTASDQSLKIGSHTFIPGFEEQLIGMNINETRDINVTFPEDYGAEHLAGKAVVFKVTLHSVSVEKIPEFDDEFVSDTSEFEHTDDYKADVKRMLTERADERADREFTDNILHVVSDNAKVFIHEDIVNTEANMQIQRFVDQLHSFGMELDAYLNYVKKTEEDFHKEYAEIARVNLKAHYVLRAIVEAEKIVPTDDEIKKVIADSPKAQEERWNDEKLKEEFEKNRDSYANYAIYDSVINFLKANAVAKAPEEAKKADKEEEPAKAEEADKAE